MPPMSYRPALSSGFAHVKSGTAVILCRTWTFKPPLVTPSGQPIDAITGVGTNGQDALDSATTVLSGLFYGRSAESNEDYKRAMIALHSDPGEPCVCVVEIPL